MLGWRRLDLGKRLIQAKKGANFLSISTTYAKTGSGFVAASAASKAGVEALTKYDQEPVQCAWPAAPFGTQPQTLKMRDEPPVESVEK